MSAGTLESSLTIKSELLGILHVNPDQIVEFPSGVYGFPEAHLYALLPTPREGLFWLQSTEHSALIFLLVDPFQHFSSFSIDLSEGDKRRLDTERPDEILALCIVTMPEKPGDPCTANLHAPLLFNVHKRHGHQSIRTGEELSLAEPLSL